MNDTVARTPFDYSDEPPSAWPAVLDERKRENQVTLRSHIPWGAHEQLRGMRDFTKSSRLRLERYLNLAQEREMQVELVVGFSPSPETFPAWTLGLSPKTLISLDAWDGRGDGFVLTEVPSIENRDLWDGFLDFVDEVFAISNLYRQPGGPVSQVSIETGVYDAGLSLFDGARYPEQLRRRYQTIEQLNLRYGTSFRSFADSTTPAGFRVLGDKRPWLVAFDYKWCRHEILSDLRKEIFNLQSAQALGNLLTLSEPDPLVTSVDNSWILLQEAVLLERTAFGACPFLPGGITQPVGAIAYQLYDYLRVHAESAQVPFAPFWPLSAEAIPVDKVLVVVSGKYLERQSHQNLLKVLQAGGQILFPMGLPQYDETLATLDWGRERHMVKVGAERLWRIANGQGAVWLPEATHEFSDSLWESLVRSANTVVQGTKVGQ